MKLRALICKPMSGMATLLLAAVFSQSVAAQDYPNKAITLVAPYAAGGDSDASGRNLAAVAAKYFSQPLVVQNIVGASGIIGSQRVRTAAADGYTLLIARGGSQAINPALDSKTPYKWNDFTMLSLLDFNPVACVVKGDSPYKSMKDLLAALKAQPGKLNYATAGPGTTPITWQRRFSSKAPACHRMRPNRSATRAGARQRRRFSPGRCNSCAITCRRWADSSRPAPCAGC